MNISRRQVALNPVLLFTTMVVAVISSLGAPLLPKISTQLHVPLSEAQWSLTATLLIGAVSSPIMGRLGDGQRRRQTMIAGLAAVTLGGVIAALAPSLPLLVVGRALQGIGLGLVPLTMAEARDHLPRERAHATISVLSVAVAAGVGVGYPISGLIADSLGLSAAFWFGTIVSFLALLSVVAVIPSSGDRPVAALDLLGAVLLTGGLIALLLAIAEGNGWGWSSPEVVGLLAGAAALLTAWTLQQLHTSAPLVELRLLRHPAVLTGDVCAIVLGTALYMYMSAITEFVQAPRSSGYGFSASVVVAGLCLVPLSISSFATSRTLPWLTERLGPRALLPLGSLVVAAAGSFFGVLHTSLWQAFVMMAILGIGVGSTSAAIPGVIVRAIPGSETGSAMGFYQVSRYIGFSLGSALTASIVAGHTPPGRHLPTVSGYTLVLWGAAGICALSAVLAWALPTGGVPDSREAELAEENAELGPAGFIGLTQE
jgi:MFS family permease